MRIVEHRAKDFNENWVFGSLVSEGYASYIAYVETETEFDGHKNNMQYSLKGIRVQQDTVGQYTGFSDKNDIKIYEGDTCIDDDGLGGVVNYEHGEWLMGHYRMIVDPEEKLEDGRIKDVRCEVQLHSERP